MIEYKHRDLKQAIFNLTCLAYIGVNDKKLIDNLNADCQQELKLYDDLKQRYADAIKILDIIKNKCSPLLKQYLLDLLPKEDYDLLKEVLL